MDFSDLKPDDGFENPPSGRHQRFKSQASLKIGRLGDNLDDEYKSDYQRHPESCTKVLGIVVLLCSILGGSSIGVVSNYIPIECPFAKNAWRAGIICVYFFLPFLYEIYSISKKKTTKIENVYTFRKYLFFLATLVMQALWVFGLM